MKILILSIVLLLASCAQLPETTERKSGLNPIRQIANDRVGEDDSCVGAIRSFMGLQIDQNTVEVKRTLTDEVMEFVRVKLSTPKNGNEIIVPKSIEKLNRLFFVHPMDKKVMDKDSLVVIKDPVYTSFHVPLEPGIMLRQGLYTNNGQLASTQWISIVFPKQYLEPNFNAHLSKFIESIVEQAPSFHLKSLEKVVAEDGSISYVPLKRFDSGKANITSFHADSLNTKSEFKDQYALDLAISPEDNIENVLLLIEKIDSNLRFKYYGQ